MTAFVRLGAWLATCWLAWAALLYASQRALVFPGASLKASTFALPPHAQRIDLGGVSPPGRALFLRSGRPAPRPAILFAHGNAEFAASNAAGLLPWNEAGFHVLLVEYPGYDGAPGMPSQHAIDALWLAAYDWLAAQPDVDARRVVGIGRSLGSGPTAKLAARRPLAAVVLQSAYADTRWFAHERWLPGFLVRDRWNNLAALSAFGGPVLAGHGRRDAVVSPRHADALALLPNVQMAWFDCGHHDCPWFERRYHDRVLAFLAAQGVIAD